MILGCEMGTVGFDCEDESLPSTSNGRKNKIIPRTLLNDCVAVNTTLVPRKLRSAMEKRGSESITPPLPISRKRHHLSNGIEKPRKEGAKKSKLNMKQRRITKDEKEVAETLFALADLFSDATKANQPGLDDEPPQTKSSTLLEDPENVTSQKKSRKTSSKVIREATHHSSNLLDSTAQVVELQSLGDTQQPKVHFSKQPSTSSASGVKPDLSLDPRQKLSTVDITPSCEQAIALERVVTASEIQYGKHYYPLEDKSNGIFPFPSFSATGTRISETNGFGYPTRFENTSSQPRGTENSVSADKNIEAVAKSNKSWKRSAAQVYICRLINVLQISKNKEGSLEKPTELAACGGLEPQPRTSIHRQTRVINGAMLFNGIKHFDADQNSGGIQNHTLLHKDQQLASETSVLCTSLKQFPVYSSMGQQMDSHKWNALLPSQYNSDGVAAKPYLPEWRNEETGSLSMIYTRALFPHLNSAISSKYQPFSLP